jgi:hypothetical protein
MNVEETTAVTTMPSMAKKPRNKPKAADQPPAEDKPGAKKRLGVNFTQDWHAVLRKLAAKRKMPVLWYLIELAREDAEKQGVADLPPLPWEEGDEAS